MFSYKFLYIFWVPFFRVFFAPIVTFLMDFYYFLSFYVSVIFFYAGFNALTLGRFSSNLKIIIYKNMFFPIIKESFYNNKHFFNFSIFYLQSILLLNLFFYKFWNFLFFRLCYIYNFCLLFLRHSISIYFFVARNILNPSFLGVFIFIYNFLFLFIYGSLFIISASSILLVRCLLHFLNNLSFLFSKLFIFIYYFLSISLFFIYECFVNIIYYIILHLLKFILKLRFFIIFFLLFFLLFDFGILFDFVSFWVNIIINDLNCFWSFPDYRVPEVEDYNRFTKKLDYYHKEHIYHYKYLWNLFVAEVTHFSIYYFTDISFKVYLYSFLDFTIAITTYNLHLYFLLFKLNHA